MLTKQQLVEWAAFTKIRGPIGGQREDYYASFIAGHARLSGLEGAKFEESQLRHPWEPEPEPIDGDDEDSDEDWD